jgi:hypothetical protein
MFAPVYKLGRFNGNRAAYVGARTGIVFNDLIVAGLSGHTLTEAQGLNDGRSVNFSYAGMFGGVNLFSSRLVHLALLNHVSWGKAVVSRLDSDEPQLSTSQRNDIVTIIEPEALAELNLTPHIRLGAGIAYRRVSGMDFSYLSEGDVRGTAYSVGLSFYE